MAREPERPLFGYDDREAARREKEAAPRRREPGMRCPACGHDKSAVVDSRAAEQGRLIRRRRRCSGCGDRFTTHEVVFGSSENAVNDRVIRRAKRLLITLMEKLDETESDGG